MDGVVEGGGIVEGRGGIDCGLHMVLRGGRWTEAARILHDYHFRGSGLGLQLVAPSTTRPEGLWSHSFPVSQHDTILNVLKSTYLRQTMQAMHPATMATITMPTTTMTTVRLRDDSNPSEPSSLGVSSVPSLEFGSNGWPLPSSPEMAVRQIDYSQAIHGSEKRTNLNQGLSSSVSWNHRQPILTIAPLPAQ